MAIFDLNQVPSDPFAENNVDVCIIGAGVAGITLALNLSKRLNIVLLEAGGLKASAESQSIYEGENVGREYGDLASGRLRFLGGTSNHWGGECRPLDSHDFKPKSYVKYSGWPIRRSDLEPYLRKSESIVDVSEEEPWDESTGYFAEKMTTVKDFRSTSSKFSPPTRFGRKYRQEIESRPNIACYLNANVTELRTTDNLANLDHVKVLNYGGTEYQVRARRFVLATGGIENPRLLLNSNKQFPTGIGNKNGLVGKFFADHFYTRVANFILEDHVTGYIGQYPFGDTFSGRLRNRICQSEWALAAVDKIRRSRLNCVIERRHDFAPSPEFMQSNEILNFSLRLRVRTPGHGRSTDGTIYIASEQAPNPLSKIELGTEVDSVGMRRVNLDWQLTEIDTHTIQKGVFHFGEIFASLGLGRIRVADWLLSTTPSYGGKYGHHHMCTTRMGTSANNGVVNRYHRVFGTDNLYIAGSSVFSTGGYANPTLTIIQMTLRLADHISDL